MTFSAALGRISANAAEQKPSLLVEANKRRNDKIFPVNRRVCTVRGLDNRGWPLTVIVEARSVYEAAALGMEAIRKEDGRPSDLVVTMHKPVRGWKVTTQQLLRWVQQYPSGENIGMKQTRRRVEDFLKASAGRCKGGLAPQMRWAKYIRWITIRNYGVA